MSADFREKIALELIRSELQAFSLPRSHAWGPEGMNTAEYGQHVALRSQKLAAACCRVWGHERDPDASVVDYQTHQGRNSPAAVRSKAFRMDTCIRCGKEINPGDTQMQALDDE